jgi:hypothetical protein
MDTNLRKIRTLLRIGYSEVTGKVPTMDDLIHITESFDKKDTFHHLANLNTLVSLYPTRLWEKFQFVQGWMLHNFSDSEFLKNFAAKFPNDNYIRDRVLFDRQQLLTIMKLILVNKGFGKRKLILDKGAQSDLGKACFIFNDLVFTKEQEERLQVGKHSSNDKEIRSEIFAQIIANAELLNESSLLHSVVRNIEYINIFSKEVAKLPFTGSHDLSNKFFEIKKVNLTRLIYLLYMAVGNYISVSDDPRHLVENPQNFNIGRDIIFSNTNFTDEEINAFFEMCTIDFETLVEMLTSEIPNNQLKLQQDFTIFRTYPLVYTSEEKKFAACIDFSFLLERCAAGFYHLILKALEGHNEDRNNFLRRYWGNVFEFYINDRFQEVLPRRHTEFFASPIFDRAKKNDEAFDGVWSRGSKFVAMEYKGKYLTLDAKYSGDSHKLIPELEDKFGKGIRQLARNLNAVFNKDENKRDTFYEQIGEINHRFELRHIKRIRRVYPLLIVQDVSISIGFAMDHLRDLFEQELKNYNIEEGLIQPLSLITIEDLERILPYLNQITLDEILLRYAHRTEHFGNFMQEFHRFKKKKRLRKPTYDWSKARFEEFHKKLRCTFPDESC